MRGIIYLFIALWAVESVGSSVDSEILLLSIPMEEIQAELYDLTKLDPLEELTLRTNIDNEVFKALETIVERLKDHMPSRQSEEPNVYLIPGYERLSGEPSRILFYERALSKLIIDIPQDWIVESKDHQILKTIFYSLSLIRAYQENLAFLTPQKISIHSYVSRGEAEVLVERIKENFKCVHFLNPDAL